MKRLPVLLLALLSTSVFAQDVSDLLAQGQRAHITGDLTTAKEKFELVRKLDPNNRVAISGLRQIMGEELKRAAALGPGGATQAQLKTVILPKIDFRDASLVEALDFLRQKANQINEGKVSVNFVQQLDEPTKTARVTLSLQNVPFTEVVRYIGELTGTQFIYERHAIVVKPKGAGGAVATPATSAPATNSGGVKVEGL